MQKFLLQLSGTIIKENLVSLTSEDRKNVIVVYDSFYGRLRIKNVELFSNVYDLQQIQEIDLRKVSECLQ